MEEVFELAKESFASKSEAKENISVEENVSEGEEREVSTSSPQLSNNSNKEILNQFRALITDYLNGETIDSPDELTQNVLSSYSLAGYLDHAVPAAE